MLRRFKYLIITVLFCLPPLGVLVFTSPAASQYHIHSEAGAYTEVTPTMTPTETPVPPTATLTGTATHTATPTPIITLTSTITPTMTLTLTPLPPTQTPTVTLTPVASNTPLAERYQVGNTGGDGVYLRASTDIDAKKIKAWPDGTPMLVIESDREIDGKLWRTVRDPDGNEGFILTEYLVTYQTPTPAPTSTPAPRNTSVPTSTPRPVNTSVPTSTPRPVNTSVPTSTPTPKLTLAEAERAQLWIYLQNHPDFGSLEVYADPSFDVARFELRVIVEGIAFCNALDIYGDEASLKLSCQASSWDHRYIENISARIPDQAFRCVKHTASTTENSVFACEQR